MEPIFRALYVAALAKSGKNIIKRRVIENELSPRLGNA